MHQVTVAEKDTCLEPLASSPGPSSGAKIKQAVFSILK
jgi:hypothetical protein